MYLAQLFLEWKMFQTIVVKKIQTHVLRSITIFSKIEPFMRQCVKNAVQLNKTQMIIRRMRIACWIPEATNTQYVIIIAFSTAKMVARTRLNITLYIRCLSVINLFCKALKYPCRAPNSVLTSSCAKYTLPRRITWKLNSSHYITSPILVLPTIPQSCWAVQYNLTVRLPLRTSYATPTWQRYCQQAAVWHAELKARLHGSISLINAIESTKLNRVNSTFQ
jgi:hypothetical protein